MAKTEEKTRTSPFAHLLNVVTGRPAKAEEEKRDEDMKAEDDDEEMDGDDDEDTEKEKAKKAKRAKKAETEDDDDEKCEEEDSDDDKEKSAAASGRRAERARCRRIFQSSAAGQRPDVAAQLAFGTNLTSAEAIDVLKAAAIVPAAPARAVKPGLGDRMAEVKTPAIGAGAGDAKPLTLAEQIVAAGKKRGTCA